MKIIVTGASGSIGRALVPHLAENHHELLLVGRDASLLKNRFPDQPNCTYCELSESGFGFDVCVHLAVMNNEVGETINAYRATNVGALQRIFSDAKSAGCDHFVNLTSFHAGDPNQQTPYAVSKREADRWLSKQSGIKITSLRLPAVYSRATTGNLAVVNRLPSFMRSTALMILGTLKPLVHMERVVEAIHKAIQKNAGGEISLSNPVDKNPVFKIFKKLIDWSFAISILALAWWLLIAVFLAIKLTSKGPVIFSQERVGQFGRTFVCYKFRTMRIGTKQAGTHDVGHDAVTNLGKFLRKSKIDELPQVFNILRGELSLVGPRPCLPMQKELVKERELRGVTDVLPGITGWAQINDIDMSDPVKLARADYDYIAQRTIPFELLIILRTFVGAGRSDRVRVAEATNQK